MNFEFLDGYLLRGSPDKASVVTTLLGAGPPVPAAGAYFEGLRMLGPRTPDLALLALRLVLAGKTADDEAVKALRGYSERARAGGPDALEATEAFHAALSEG